MKVKLIAPPLLLLGAVAVSGFGVKSAEPSPTAPSLSKMPTKLSKAQMSGINGAGSTCRMGCNEDNEYCFTVDGVSGEHDEVWQPHLECAFAWGSDTCVAGADTWCRKIITYYLPNEFPWWEEVGHCERVKSETIQSTTSTCILPVDPNPGND